MIRQFKNSMAPGPRRPGRNLFAPLNALGLLSVLCWAGCGKEEKKEADDPPPFKVDAAGESITFETNAPQLTAIEVRATEPRKLAVTHVTGRLYWDEEVTVHVFTPVIGRVTRVLADLGDPISVGTPLAEIDSPDFAMALSTARTDAGNLMAAEKAFARTKALLAHGANSQKDVEASEAAYVAALAERDRALAVLANYGGGLKPAEELARIEAAENPVAGLTNHAGVADATNSQYLLRSHLAGVLVDKTINPGQEVRPDQMLANYGNVVAPLFVVTDPTKLWLQVDVAEADLPAMEPGLQLRIKCNAFPGRVFDGVIEKVGDTMEPGTRTVKIRGVVNNPDKLLKAEMYVMVDVVRDTGHLAESGVNVPAKALFMKGNESYLFVEESPGHYQRRKVQVGIEKDDIVPVFDGVASGQKVVTEGALLLQAVLEPAD